MDSLQKCSVPIETWSSTFHPSTLTSFPACSSPVMLDFRVSSYLQCKKAIKLLLTPSFSVLTESIQAEVIKQSCPWCPGLLICSCLLTYWSKNARGPGQTGENTQENGQEAYCLEAWRWGMQAAWLWRATKRQSLHVIGWAHWSHRTCRHRSFRTRTGNWCQRWNHFGNLGEQWSPQEAVNKDRNLLKVDWWPEMRLSLSRKPATEIESMNCYLFTIKRSFIINFICNTENSSCVQIDLWKTHVKLQTDSQPVCYTGICSSL